MADFTTLNSKKEIQRKYSFDN